MSNKKGLTRGQWWLVIFSMFVILWSMGLITIATFQMFYSIPEISGSAATAYTGLIGIICTLTGFMSKKLKEFYDIG